VSPSLLQWRQRGSRPPYMRNENPLAGSPNQKRPIPSTSEPCPPLAGKTAQGFYRTRLALSTKHQKPPLTGLHGKAKDMATITRGDKDLHYSLRGSWDGTMTARTLLSSSHHSSLCLSPLFRLLHTCPKGCRAIPYESISREERS
jgi:hypothetical protein